jgi:hypothetical protein
MPVGVGGGAGSVRALGWTCREMWKGVACPAGRPWWRTAMSVRSCGSNTSSTRAPASAGSTWYWLPCRLTVAVELTVRHSPHRNASASRSAGTGAGGPAARNRVSGGCPVSEWTRRW